MMPRHPPLATALSVGRAGIRDTLRVTTKVLAPTIAKGVIIRRPVTMAAAERLQADATAIRALQGVRARLGTAPLRLRIPGRSVVVLLDPTDVARVLDGSPEPFALATREKTAALSHFQPHGVLISTGRLRAERRTFNETVLQSSEPLHQLATPIVDIVRGEAARISGISQRAGVLDWPTFATGWWRAVRSIVLGRQAREDVALTELLARLRADANWAYLHPKRSAQRQQFEDRLRDHLRRAEPGSLAHTMAGTPAKPDVDPAAQVPHWIFAFDAAAIVTFRALALLATHPAEADAARLDTQGRDLAAPQLLPRLRAALLESVRLWPTTPLLLRESDTPTTWGDQRVPAHTTFLIYTPLFHRDNERLPYADRFEPSIWLDGTALEQSALVPFSGGPGQCPGENLVLLTCSTMLAALTERPQITLGSTERLSPEHPLPATLNHFRLKIGAATR